MFKSQMIKTKKLKEKYPILEISGNPSVLYVDGFENWIF